MKIRLMHGVKFSVISACVCGLLLPSIASSQVLRESWQFKAQNRASIASLIKQVEDSSRNSGSVGSATTTPSVTSLVCGGDGESSARGNATCVILNNATGNIELTQASEGDQSSEKTTSGTDEILELLE